MKSYIIFAISFVLLFSLFQVLSGIILTITYTPDIEEVWNMSANLPDEVVMQGSSSSSFFYTLFIAFLSATIAYFIPKKFTKHSNSIK
ncbi:ABC-type Fe3+ transport system permease subunit [Virgibacillus natechei]|uniref:ABC-type Fe3+ transport system permease subunit n=1 Tax=Virgibacillus natechei TaxID=1216297 RepID=A0ABS4IGT5_9BACI|nr:hypothetical protein [Virgibacillus natechei]MBP1970165.1 ABC-type Fe3+ transport system permease subunit [Virgibacillus natechei]UZD12882.1 hypothetical protein OLD84_18675 [Virgibacillus natechei]